MSKPRYIWWEFAKNMIRQYPELKKEYEQLHSPKVNRELSCVRGSGSISRSTEIVAIKSLTPARQREYDAVTQAIKRTERMETGIERLAVVDMVLMKRITNIAGASMRLNVSEVTAKRWHGDFIRLVGFCYGLEDVE